MLTILAAHAPAERRSHRLRQPSWWNADCLQHVLLGMVPFRTAQGCVLRSRICGSAQLDNSSIAQSAQPDGISGRSGKIMCPPFQHTTCRFNSTNFSVQHRFSQVERVQWPDLPDPPPGHESVPLCVSRGSTVPGSFDGAFFEEVVVSPDLLMAR